MARPLFLLALLGTYLLLPFFGSAWHNLAPEHDHIYLAAAQVDDVSPALFTQANAAALSAGRLGLGWGEMVVHALNPSAALQLFVLVIGLGALTLPARPRGLTQRVAAAGLFLRFPPLFPLDPPPVA